MEFNINKIEITINDLKNYSVDLKNNTLNDNSLNSVIDLNEWTSKFLRIIRTWDKLCINNDVSDGIRVEINIYDENNKLYKYEIINELPKNFDSFSMLLNELEGLI